MFNFDSDDRPALEGVVQIDPDPGTAKFDLTLELNAGPNGILGSFEYCTDLFEKSRMRQWSRQFPALVEDMVRHPDRPLRELVLVLDVEAPPVDPPQGKPTGKSGWRAGMARMTGRFSRRRET